MIGKLNAIATYIAWLMLAGICVSFILGFFDVKLAVRIYVIIFGSFFSFALMHLILAYWVRCPYCKKCLTIQGLGAAHSDSIHKTWSSVIFHWFTGRVGCIHCGKTVSTNDL